MPADAQRWDERYRSESFSVGTEPTAFLQEALPLLPRGRALDLAMGAGRNAVFLAMNGWQVTGIDYSHTALEKAAALAREHSLSIHWGNEPHRQFTTKSAGLLLLEADLEHSSLPSGQFELVVCFNYLQRSLFAPIERALRTGGMLVYETYTVEQLSFPGGPHHPEHLLRPHELRAAFSVLEILFFREFRIGKGIASLLARKP
jgi:SAM-dependent methyltransferase